MAQAAAPTRKPRPARFSRAAVVRQALASFAAVVACYWMYWLVAVPLIEPTIEDRATTRASDEQIEQARGDVSARQQAVAQYFQGDDWEAHKPAIWQSGQMRLLFKNLQPKPDGTVEVRPCTLLFFPKNDKGPERPIIMRAAEGANIRFDQPIVLKNVDLAQRRFVGGHLVGEIRIHRQASAPGAGDDLEITTRDIEMSEDRAWTAQPVHFRFGKSYGSGRDLEIELGASGGGQPPNVMRGATFRKLMLKRDVRMRLEMDAAAEAGTPQVPPPPAEPPIEITCQGRFEFEMEEYAASFHDNVDVFRLNPTGESDQLNCALLTVYFARPGEPREEANSTDAAGAQLSQVRMIEARGNPVTLRSPAQGMYARCKGIDYIPGPPGSPGSLAAFGPGVIHGNLPNDPSGKYVAQWARQLRFEPDGPQQRVTLRGATQIEFGTLGTVTADEVFAWLSKRPAPPKPQVAQVALHAAEQPAADADAWQLERVVARRYPDPTAETQGDVVIDGPQMHAVAAVFEAIVDRSTTAPLVPQEPAGRQGAAGAPGAGRAGQRPQQNPNERFQVAGRGVQIRLVPRGKELAVSGATIEHQAQLEQFSTVELVQQRTLFVKGDRLHVVDADTPDTRVTITGAPGCVEAGGMTLWGAAIELEKRESHLWINGPGQLTMPITQDLDGQPLAQPGQLTIDWKTRMDFQSNTAVFEGMVVARSQQQRLDTEKLQAVLTRTIDFGNPNPTAGSKDARPELAEVRTFGRTFLEGRQMDEQGVQSSFSQMELADLSVNRGTGEIAGVGPGWVRHVARGAAPSILAPQDAAQDAAEKPAEAKPDDAKPDENALTYLYITFQKALGGNINRRAVKFTDRTRTVYGPVKDWTERLDGRDPAALGPQGMTLDAAELEVREMNRKAGGKRGYFELDATGAVSAEGQRFTALGERLTYAEEKDQLILRGNPAEMFLENESGGPRNEMRVGEVHYWFARHYVSVSGAQNVNFALPPAKGSKPPDAGAKPRDPQRRSPGKPQARPQPSFGK